MPFNRELIEAQLSLKVIATSDTPKIAWDALEAGLDGPAIRRLAALDHPTWSELDPVLPRAMQEMHLAVISIGEAARRFAVQRAREIIHSGKDPLRHAVEFERLWIRADYAKELQSVGTLIDDISIAEYSGKSEKEIRQWVAEVLKSFIDE
jgi:hypothetical protein